MGVWLARRQGLRAAEIVPASQAAAVKLDWTGRERVDSTVGELFGALAAVLAGSLDGHVHRWAAPDAKVERMRQQHEEDVDRHRSPSIAACHRAPRPMPKGAKRKPRKTDLKLQGV